MFYSYHAFTRLHKYRQKVIQRNVKYNVSLNLYIVGTTIQSTDIIFSTPFETIISFLIANGINNYWNISQDLSGAILNTMNCIVITFFIGFIPWICKQNLYWFIQLCKCPGYIETLTGRNTFTKDVSVFQESSHGENGEKIKSIQINVTSIKPISWGKAAWLTLG